MTIAQIDHKVIGQELLLMTVETMIKEIQIEIIMTKPLMTKIKMLGIMALKTRKTMAVDKVIVGVRTMTIVVVTEGARTMAIEAGDRIIRAMHAIKGRGTDGGIVTIRNLDLILNLVPTQTRDRGTRGQGAKVRHRIGGLTELMAKTVKMDQTKSWKEVTKHSQKISPNKNDRTLLIEIQIAITDRIHTQKEETVECH